MFIKPLSYRMRLTTNSKGVRGERLRKEEGEEKVKTFELNKN